MASPLTAIPDHLLVEIFLRLPDPADLAYASATYISFRRLTTDASFLHSFCRLHAPPLFGFLEPGRFRPALPPHPSASAAHTFALAADLSYSFLPSHCRWTVQDIRDGRVLLHREPGKGEEPPVFRELAVCDPLHRRYVLLPPVPDDLATSVEDLIPMVHKPQCKSSLVPLSDEETAAAEATSYRVLWMSYSKTKLAAIVFSSSTGQWQVTASKDWSDLVIGRGELAIISQINPVHLKLHCAYGCFYWDWLLIGTQKLLVLDTRRTEFSITDLPPGEWSWHRTAIVEAGQGRLGVLGLHDEISSHLRYAIARNKGESPRQCQMEKTISLESGYQYYIRDATERYLLFTRTEEGFFHKYPRKNPLVEYFSMDVKTLQLQRVCAKQVKIMHFPLIYTDFPPSLLSSRTI